MYNQEEDVCLICNELILKPAILPCKHQFCCFCIQSIKYKNQDQKIVCPLCRRVTDNAPMNQQRQFKVIETVMKDKNVRVFWATASTTNDYDNNLTISRGFFYILHNNILRGDIIWGQGTMHSSYVDEVARAAGKVQVLPNTIIYGQQYRPKYSNTPEQKWSGIFKLNQNGIYQLENGRYEWKGWGRSSSGTLDMELVEIKSNEELYKYRSTKNNQ